MSVAGSEDTPSWDFEHRLGLLRALLVFENANQDRVSTPRGVDPPRRHCYLSTMSNAARKLIDEAMGLTDDERLQVAVELLASVDGPPDGDWQAAWLEELERRRDRVRATGRTRYRVARGSRPGSAASWSGMKREVRVLPEAEEELAAAAQWYEERRPGLGVQFVATVDAAVESVAQAPLACPIWLEGYPYRKLVDAALPVHRVLQGRR